MFFFPWISTFLTGFLTWLVGFFGYALAKRILAIGLATSAFTALSLTMITAIRLSASALVAWVAVPPSILTGVATFMPANAPLCLTTILTVKTARWVFDWGMKNLEILTTTR